MNKVKVFNDVDLKDRLVAINRVTKVTKGGREVEGWDGLTAVHLVLAEKIFSEENFDAEGVPPSSPRGRVGLCRGKAEPSLMVRLSV